MKNQYLLPAVAVVLGFAIGWVAKPAPDVPTPDSGEITKPVSSAKPPRRDGPSPRGSGPDRPLAEVNPADYGPADMAAEPPKSRDDAKMVRLVEALGLDSGQQEDLLKLIDENQRSASDGEIVISEVTARANALEAALKQLFTPDQLVKFEELRLRERENRVEARAQKNLTRVIEEIDLSPQQRTEALARLRQSAKSEFQAIPAAAGLLVDSSVLPTGSRELTVEGLLLLHKIGEQPPVTDPGAALRQNIEMQRQEMQDQLRLFEGIFTPAQMDQYRTMTGKSSSILSRLESQNH